MNIFRPAISEKEKKMLYEIKSSIIGWFGNIQVFKYPFFILFGSSSYKIKGQHQRQIMDILKPGDVLLRRYNNYLSGLMIPGYFTHAAMYVGDNQMIHVLGGGMCKEDILTFLRCDNTVVLRFKDQSKVEAAVKNAYEQLERKVEYDFDFNTDNAERFYCTEFVDFCFDYPVKAEITHKTILPDDFLESDKFEVVWTKRK